MPAQSLDKGDEIIVFIRNFCQNHKIKLAAVTGIGAVNKASVDISRQDTKEYHSTDLEGNMEITSLMGNVSQKDGEVVQWGFRP